MKNQAKKKFKRKLKRRRKATDKRNFPRKVNFKSKNKSNSETITKDNHENKIKELFPPQELNFESFPEFHLNEDISTNEQDLLFPKDFDLNINDPNYQNEKILQQYEISFMPYKYVNI